MVKPFFTCIGECQQEELRESNLTVCLNNRCEADVHTSWPTLPTPSSRTQDQPLGLSGPERARCSNCSLSSTPIASPTLASVPAKI